MFRNPFKDFLYFGKADRRAIFAILAIAVFCIGIVCIIDSLERNSEEDKSVGAKAASVKGESGSGEAYGYGEKGLNGEGKVALHEFDPNTVDSAALVSFGIKPYKVKNFLHYRAAGKIFTSAEDLGKTYGWDEADVAMVARYVRVSADVAMRKRNSYYRAVKHDEDDNGHGTYDRKKRNIVDGSHYNASTDVSDAVDAGGRTLSTSGSKEQRKFDAHTVVDVNEADSATLRRIPGVGEKICRAILRYRDRLGGMYDVEQLLDIKIVSPELLRWFCVGNAKVVRKIKINAASFQSLNAHPYIRYEQAGDLLRYIRLYGKIKDEKALASTGIFTVEEIGRLRPYIEYD